MQVIYVRDSELPEANDWAVVRRRSGSVVAFVKRSRVGADLMAEVDAACRELQHPVAHAAEG